MALKNMIQEMKDGLESFSRRSFEIKLHRRRYQSSVRDEMIPRAAATEKDEEEQQVNWSNMLPELLTEMIQRVEASEGAWPGRKYVVSCAAVCKSWRDITKEIVKAPDQSGKLTFLLLSSRLGVLETSLPGEEADESDMVELEKSNVLLLGPTGSG